MLSAIVLFTCAAPVAWGAKGGPHRTAAHPRGPVSQRTARLLGTAFRARGGAGEIVIQTSGEVELEARNDGAQPLFVLKRCRALRPNDRRPLDTRFFDSPVTGVTLRRRGADLQISVSLRAQSTTSPRKEHGPGNTWYWILSFPPGTTADRSTRAANP